MSATVFIETISPKCNLFAGADEAILGHFSRLCLFQLHLIKEPVLQHNI